MILQGYIYFLGTLFLNSCLHGLQKLNDSNHILKSYLQAFELDLKFMVVWKIKFKYLKVGEMFLQVFGFFFPSTSILMWWIFIYIFG